MLVVSALGTLNKYHAKVLNSCFRYVSDPGNNHVTKTTRKQG